MNKQHTQDNQPITIDEAKKIFYNSKNMKAFAQNKDELIYNKDKSNNDEVFIETSFGGMNTSVKHHAIIDRNTGEIIKTGGAITYSDGPIDNEDGYIDKDIYNTTADFYNTYVYKQGMPKYEKASSDVPEDKYKKLSKLVGNYSEEQKENKSDKASTKNSKTKNENEEKQSDEHQKNVKSNEQTKEPSANDKQNSGTTEENNNDKNTENNKKSSQKQKNNKEDVTEQEAEDMVYDWYKKSSYGARLRNEFHVNKDKSNKDEYYVDFAASDARGHPIKSQAIVDRTTGEIKEITYLSSDDPKVDKMLPNEEEKI